MSHTKFEAQQSAAWRNTVRNAVAYQQRQTLLNELEAAMTPPQPPSEPEATIVYGQDEGSPDFGPDFNPALFNKKPRSWW
jgi:hypothetical protein